MPEQLLGLRSGAKCGDVMVNKINLWSLQFRTYSPVGGRDIKQINTKETVYVINAMKENMRVRNMWSSFRGGRLQLIINPI